MTHLEDHDFETVLAGKPLSGAAEEHLEVCLSCRRQLGEIESLIAERRRTFEAEAPDWERQQQKIMARLAGAGRSAPRRRRWTRPLLAAAAAVLAVIGLSEIEPPSTPVDPPIEPDFQIEEILAEVDAVLSDDTLPGFESIDPGFDDPESMLTNGAS